MLQLGQSTPPHPTDVMDHLFMNACRCDLRRSPECVCSVWLGPCARMILHKQLKEQLLLFSFDLRGEAYRADLNSTNSFNISPDKPCSDTELLANPSLYQLHYSQPANP